MIFTKFASSLTGPVGDLSLPTDTVDWEIELVAVIGRTASNVSAATAWDHVAGLTVGQDIPERTAQMAGTMPQFSLAKSYPGFAPTGPHLVTPDEMPDLDDIKLRTLVNGDVVQDGNTRNMIFTVPALIASLSAVCPLLPGDLIFTGTPDGVGMGRTPPTYLRPGDELTSHIDGIGTLRQRCQAGATPSAPQLAHAGDEQR
jgi:2-keto-4-pentenoate hydratase/2-oxohepta-3-ene-1,7-dioic acid hydratase in catechol pathway